MSITVDQLADMVTADQRARLTAKYGAEMAADTRAIVRPGRKYTKVDVSTHGGTHGMLMVNVATGDIFGIKGYGQVHTGHRYGTLDTATAYFWGEYYPRPSTPAERQARQTSPAPQSDHTPADPGHPVFSVGDGATVHIGSDAEAYTVIATTAKTARLQRDVATLSPDFKPVQHVGGFAAHTSNNDAQSYTYESDPSGPVIVARLTRRGWMSGRGKVSAGRREFYDYNL